MFRFTIRDMAGVIGGASLFVVVAAAAFAIGWWRNDPRSKIGSLRQGLENVQQGAANRDLQVNELVSP